jgi:AbrB family looped-hinge helix DNA binding protein
MESVIETPLRASARLNENGRVVIPAPIRKKLGFTAGDTLLMDVEDGVLRIESYAARIRRIQQEIAQCCKPRDTLASDELIAERREEARREEEELQRDLAADRERFGEADQVG